MIRELVKNVLTNKRVRNPMAVKLAVLNGKAVGSPWQD